MWLTLSGISTCVPGSGASPSGSGSPTDEFAPSAMSNWMRIARPSSWFGWKRRPWSRHLFGAARSKTWMDASFAGMSTSSPQDSPVSPGVLPGDAKERTTSDGSGPRFTAASAKWSQLRCSLRTSPSTLFDSRSGTFETWASSCRHLCAAEQPTSEPPTDDTDSSLWPTATSQDCRSSGAIRYSTESGRHKGTTLTDAARVWASPAARDAKGAFKRRRRQNCLTRQVREMTGEDGGGLNPSFAEMLMGFPLGWTDCGPLGTHAFLKWWLASGGGS